LDENNQKENLYYFTKSGYRAAGVVSIQGDRYYFDKKGIMQKGWQEISAEHKTCYFDPDTGKMITGEYVIDGKTYVSVTNIGSRPTVGGHQVRSESWILDLDGDLYGKRITLKFHKFLRPEQKFDSLEELRAQIQHDAAKAYGLLK
jgi:glucan-binding repeat-containing protein